MKSKTSPNSGINPPVKKKHILILEEIERRIKANNRYCEQNGSEASQFLLGQNDVLEDLVNFINKL